MIPASCAGIPVVRNMLECREGYMLTSSLIEG